jgi:hypothetical protein
MAKKKAARKKGKTAKKRAGGFRLNVTNLKFINAAFDTAIADLQAIRTNAQSKSDVDAKIKKLQSIRARVARECPQNWYVPFAVES